MSSTANTSFYHAKWIALKVSKIYGHFKEIFPRLIFIELIKISAMSTAYSFLSTFAC